jgi:hypothetical protein
MATAIPPGQRLGDSVVSAEIINIADRKPLELAPAFSEEALALSFTANHEDDLRFVPDWGWLHYVDGKWHLDKQLVAFDFSRELCRQAARECNKEKQSSALASKKTVAAVESLARSDRRIIAATDQWDVDPFLLATPNGTVDLTTGSTTSIVGSAGAASIAAIPERQLRLGALLGFDHLIDQRRRGGDDGGVLGPKLPKLLSGHRLDRLGEAQVKRNALVRAADTAVKNQLTRAQANVVTVFWLTHDARRHIDRFAATTERHQLDLVRRFRSTAWIRDLTGLKAA